MIGEIKESDVVKEISEPNYIDTVTPGGVAYNLNKATFDHCVFDNNQNYESMVGWESETRTQGGVLYAETNSFTSFIACKFLSKHDNIYASNKSSVVFYDLNDSIFDFIVNNSYLSMISSFCVRDINSLNSNTSLILNYSDVDSLLKVHNDIKSFNNASGYVINLENKTYSFNQDQYKNMIDQRKEWRTKILDPLIYYIPLKDRGILDMDSRAIVVNGHGATIKLEMNSINNDYHFAYVPKHSSLTLVNITFSGFNSAILNYGTLFIINCTFEGNSYYSILEYSNGGAIKNYGGIYCFNSTFANNSASKGGAIYSEGASAQALIVNCSFSNNKIASLKSIFYNDFNALYLTDNTVVKLVNCTGIGEYNIVTKEEGMFMIRSEADPSVYNVVIDSVSSLMKLSKMLRDNDGYDIINVTFVKGDYAVFPDSKVLFEMDYGKLIIHGNGARIIVQNPKNNDETQFLTTTIRSYVVIGNLIVEGFNTAIVNSGHLEISNSNFINNKVDYIRKDDYGGAIVNKGTLLVYNSLFKNNYAKYGGAIYNTGSVTVINSTFKDNTGYKSKSNVDIYTHQGNAEIISMGSLTPKTTEHFPMTQWQEDLLQSAVYLATALVVSWATYGTSSNSISHWISTLVGAVIGGTFGAVHGAVYSNSHQDYSTFWTKVFKGVSDGMEFVEIGEAVSEMADAEMIDIHTREGWVDVLGYLLDEFTSRSWELLSDYIADEFLAGPPENEINIVYVPRIL